MNRSKTMALLLPVLTLLLACNLATARGPKRFVVSRQGDDQGVGSIRDPFRTIQHGLDMATVPGDTVQVRGGNYRERVRFTSSGSQQAGPITLRNYRKERVVLDGRQVTAVNNHAGQDMVLIENLNHVRLIGLNIVNNLGVTDGSGVRVLGHGHHIVILNNVIREMRGRNAMGITVYATSTQHPISHITIKGNHIFRCDPAPSEALTVNGNVLRFRILENLVHDVNNIGIDAIGGELDINPDPTLVARYGLIARNTVFNARSSYGGGFGAGIYVDGGRNIRIDSNEVFRCDLGIEVGAENQGVDTRHVSVRNNFVHRNDKAGIVFGGYDTDTGRVRQCRFVNNTLYQNDSLNLGFGQVWVQYAHDNVVANNIIWGSGSGVMLQAEPASLRNRFDFNLWFLSAGSEEMEFIWRGDSVSGLDSFRTSSRQAAHSIFGNPAFASLRRGDFALRSASPAIDTGTGRGGWFAPHDFNAVVRPQFSGIDRGAVEFTGQQ